MQIMSSEIRSVWQAQTCSQDQLKPFGYQTAIYWTKTSKTMTTTSQHAAHAKLKRANTK
jgi:hypothetical protein